MKLDNLDYATSYINGNPHDEQNFASYLDVPYLMMLRQVRDYGIRESNRTGTDTLSIFGLSSRYDLRGRFPLLTSKQMPWKNTVQELLWFLSGSTNAADIEKHGNKFWSQWGNADRDMGPIYGDGFRSFGVTPPGGACCGDPATAVTDQLNGLIEGLVTNPGSRRHLITLWNPHTVDRCALPPCHGIVIQFKRQVDQRGVERLHCCMYQRSCDMLLGVPVNIASYALLTHLLVAYLQGFGISIFPGFLTHFLGDAHIYVNHLPAVQEQLDRTILLSPVFEVPSGFFSKHNILNLSVDAYEDLCVGLSEYEPHGKLTSDVTVAV